MRAAYFVTVLLCLRRDFNSRLRIMVTMYVQCSTLQYFQNRIYSVKETCCTILLVLKFLIKKKPDEINDFLFENWIVGSIDQYGFLKNIHFAQYIINMTLYNAFRRLITSIKKFYFRFQWNKIMPRLTFMQWFFGDAST